MDNEILMQLKELFRAELEPIKETIKDIQDDMKHMKEEQKKTNERLDTMESEQKKTNERLDTIESEQKKTNERLANLENSQQRIEKKMDAIYDHTADLTEFRTETKHSFENIQKNVDRLANITTTNCLDIADLRAVK